MQPDLAARAAFLVETDRLKSVLRRNFPAHLARLENSAEHSWSLAIMVMLFADCADEAVDAGRALRLAVVHDLVEIHAGDTFCYDQAAHGDKAEREQAAADVLFADFPEFRALWEEFESAATPEARLANALDRILPLFQHRANEGVLWKKHGITRVQVLERIAPAAASSKKLHEFACGIVDDAVRTGWLIA